ncbi:GNAT family N-acetyltransferase [Kribbella sp. NPDC005582]|uniref:GNAT family N-acetyltransferase n=1 Tax=Kribbella sp. NPDC005582 TaxID=3156893 RepID=UPI0033B721ED
MIVRTAEPADAAAINVLFEQLGYPDQDTGSTVARIRSWQADPSSTAAVADAGGNLLGVVAVHVGPYFERPGSWARIVALVVSEEVRGQGIGGRLLTVAEGFAVERGCVRIELSSADRRTEAHAFYVSRGYIVQTGRSSWFRREVVRR